MIKGVAKPYFIVAGLFSVAVNLLMLISPLYMLQIYDRVLTSGSIDTLILVSIVAVGLLFVYGFAEAARRRTMVLMAAHVQSHYGPAVFRASLSDVGETSSLPENLRDLGAVQFFFQNGLILPLFDLPFTPFFILAMFLIHPIIGWIGVVGAVLLIIIAIFTELISRKSADTAQSAEQMAIRFGQEVSRRRSAIVSLGMLEPMLKEWLNYRNKANALAIEGTSLSTFLTSHARGLRLMLQISVLGVGAFLVLQQQASAGAIIAGSIIMGRALAPIDQTLGAWRQIVRAHMAWKSVKKLFDHPEAILKEIVPLPRPKPVLNAENLQVSLPGAEAAILPKFNLTLSAGTAVVLIGQSGSGKTSLLQTLTGVWPAFSGAVRLGGCDLHRWAERDRGRFIGYLPQNIDLLPGTVAQNINRFLDGDTEQVVQAATKAGYHNMILRLPNGYETKIGPGGAHLSRGQMQAIALTRAFYDDPVFLCFDEPSANLDSDLFESLKNSLMMAKREGAIIVLSTHDLRLLSVAEKVMVLRNGDIKMFEAKDYIESIEAAKKSAAT